MRPHQDFDEDQASPALVWAGGAAVTGGIMLALAIAQTAL